jgi:abhydrolase domain-containing protein 14
MLKYGIYSVQDGSKLFRILLALVVVVSIIYFLFGRKTLKSHDIEVESHDVKAHTPSPPDLSSPSSLHNHPPSNFLAPPIPEDIVAKSSDVSTTQGHRTVQGCQVFFRQTSPLTTPKEEVLLLHGAHFSSKTWSDLKTLQQLTAMGHRTVAIDIPGFGQSSGSITDPADFLAEILSTFNLNSPIIISPSLSGKISLPFLVKYPEKVKGFMPIAPVDTENYVKEFPSITVATVIVYGELDEDLGRESTKNLQNLPNTSEVEIPGAGHAAYMDRPEIWNTMLYNYLRSL